MRQAVVTLLFIVAGCFAQTSGAGEVGAFWSFQQGKRPPLTGRYSEKVSYENLPGKPEFRREGTVLENKDSVKGLFKMFNGESWPSGRAALWRFDFRPTPGSSFQITFDSSAATEYRVRMTCDVEKLFSGGQRIESFSAFEYKIDDGEFLPVRGVDLSFPSNVENEWSADLSNLKALDRGGKVTLRWSLSETDAVANAAFLLDNLQITGKRK